MNTHIEHLEDLIITEGIEGFHSAFYFLNSLIDILSDKKSNINVSTKWDGAPAIVAGTNPENGKFFVATKSIFNKTPKINYTPKDIDMNHPSDGLNHNLKVALHHLPRLGIKGIHQGDMMFTQKELATEKLNGEQYVTFQPNALVYAMPANSTLGKNILSSQMGVVWHTQYTGKIGSLKSSLGVKTKFKTSKNVWSRDANIKLTKLTKLTPEEAAEISEIMLEAMLVFRSIPMSLLSSVTTHKNLIKMFNNTKVRAGKKITNTEKHTQQLIDWVDVRLSDFAIDARRESTRNKREAERKQVLDFLCRNAEELKDVFELQLLIADAKTAIIRKLEQADQSAQTFFRSARGLKEAKPEGFVCVGPLGNAAKLVDRLSFSHHNFNERK